MTSERAWLLQVPRGRLRGVEVAEEMRVHDALEDLHRIVVEEGAHQRVGAVGDHDVQLPERFRRFVHRRLYLPVVGGIGLHQHRLPSGRPHLGEGIAARRFVPVIVHGDIGAGHGQAPAQCPCRIHGTNP